MGLKGPVPISLQADGELQAHRLAHGMYALRVYAVELLGDIGFRWQGQSELFEGGV